MTIQLLRPEACGTVRGLDRCPVSPQHMKCGISMGYASKFSSVSIFCTPTMCSVPSQFLPLRGSQPRLGVCSWRKPSLVLPAGGCPLRRGYKAPPTKTTSSPGTGQSWRPPSVLAGGPGASQTPPRMAWSRGSGRGSGGAVGHPAQGKTWRHPFYPKV